MSKKETIEKRILARRSNQIIQVISNSGFLLDRDSLKWEREETEGPDSDLKRFSNSFRTIMTYFNFELPLSKLEFINVLLISQLSHPQY